MWGQALSLQPAFSRHSVDVWQALRRASIEALRLASQTRLERRLQAESLAPPSAAISHL
jgi:hypothetical protein